MNVSDIRTIYDYNDWANRRLWEATKRVTQEQFVGPNPRSSFKSLRGTLVHILDTEYSWGTLCQTSTFAGFDVIKPEDFPTLDALIQRWTEQQRAVQDYLARVTDDEINGYVRYTNERGEKGELVRWHGFWNIVNHGTEHRSEAAAIVTEYGSSPGEMDFAEYLNEHKG